MPLGIAADVIANMAVHGVVVTLRHTLAALSAAFAIFKKVVGGVFHGKFRGIAAKCSRPYLTLGCDPIGVRFFAAVELAALAMAVAIPDVDKPTRGLHAVGVLPCAFSDHGHEVFLSGKPSTDIPPLHVKSLSETT